MPSLLTGRPRPAPKWRYIVQRATTRQILTREADIHTDDETYKLSAVGSATFVTTPVLADKIAADGERMFGKWRTLIAAEADGQIRWRGIVTGVDVQGATRTITVDSMGTAPNGIPYLGDEYYGAEVDPADVFRRIWAHVQSFTSPKSDLGVRVVGKTGLSIGTYSTQNKADTLAAYNAAVNAWHAAVAARRAAQADETAARDTLNRKKDVVRSAANALSAATKTKDKAKIAAAQTVYNDAVADRNAQQNVVDQRTSATDAAAKVVDQREDTKSDTYKKKVAASKAAKADGGAYTLLWWEMTDCGQALASLASDNGFDWYERHRWNPDRSDIITEVVVAYPRAGTRRRDLTFEQGLNVTIAPSLQDDGDSYANVQVLIGAGEGAGSIRRETATNDGGLRRVAVISAKDVKSNAVADKRLRAAAPTALLTEGVDSITVTDHEMAPIGSWSVGDDIRIDFYSAALDKNVKLWHRITEWTRTGPRTATIKLRRSNSYTYGG